MRKNLFTVTLALFLALFLGNSVAHSKSEKRKNRDELYRQVGLFSDTLAIIKNDYVDETNPKDLIYGALKGMLSSLDAHSQFMDPDTYSDLKVDTEGKFGGLGIEITIKDGLLTVITPIEDTPAWRAGIKPNDHIVKINDELTREMTITDAVKKMRGKTGENVTLSILRNTEKKLLDFKITRAIIKIKDVKHALILEDRIGYIRLTEFRENTLQEFNNALSNLSKQGMNALIIDLRNNPGGLLDVAVKIAGKFITSNKLIVYTKSRRTDQTLKFYSEGKNSISKLTLVILINEGSASGSEIVAGALQDYKRAIIIGTKSFGKGSVQTVIPLGDGSALRLTTSRYFTPSGKIIHGLGVTPDIVIEADKYRLENNGLPSDKPEGNGLASDGQSHRQNQPNSRDMKNTFDYKTDSQITRAIDALKVIRLCNEK